MSTTAAARSAPKRGPSQLSIANPTHSEVVPELCEEPVVEPLFSPTPAEVEERMQRELFRIASGKEGQQAQQAQQQEVKADS